MAGRERLLFAGMVVLSGSLLIGTVPGGVRAAQAQSAGGDDARIVAEVQKQLENKRFVKVTSAVHDGNVTLGGTVEKALEQAEAAFRKALKTRNAALDPLAWAVTQVALARIYEAQSALRPDTGERADAAFALASAIDVFSERGLRTLSTAALSSLDRLKERA